MLGSAWHGEFQSSAMLPTRMPEGGSKSYSSFEDAKFNRLRTNGQDARAAVDFKGWRCCAGVLAFLIASIILLTAWHLKVISQISTPAAPGHRRSPAAQPHHALPQHRRSAPMCVPPETKPSMAGDALPAISERLGESRLLVFEAGEDAEYWLASNCAGSTLMLQADESGMERHPRTVQMHTRVMHSDVLDATPEMIDDEARLTGLAMERLPKEVRSGSFDEILIESGGASNLNIFAARKLAGPTTTIFVDDCNHAERSAFMRRWFAEDGIDVSIYGNGRGGLLCKAGPGIPAISSKVAADAPAATWQPVVTLAGLVGLYAAVMCSMRLSVMQQVGKKR
eukprot:TRINITY_DN126457_c0_g1_i1.p1 TRINITY_DN126457_c0_g1~~TRINITY_DN126457_c0_g1_i1.p1  ORF type:complete len:339 (+),score=91.52 TRINITY_DN126457_c0_g1_i1:64-1080(+)